MITDMRRSINLVEQLIRGVTRPTPPPRLFEFIHYLIEDDSQPSDADMHKMFQPDPPDTPLPPDATTGPPSVQTTPDGSQPSDDDLRKQFDFHLPQSSDPSDYLQPGATGSEPSTPSTPSTPPTPPTPPEAPTAPPTPPEAPTAPPAPPLPPMAPTAPSGSTDDTAAFPSPKTDIYGNPSIWSDTPSASDNMHTPTGTPGSPLPTKVFPTMPLPIPGSGWKTNT